MRYCLKPTYIIGPSLKSKIAGGVVTHVKFLSTLKVFDEANFIKIDSLGSNPIKSLTNIFIDALKLIKVNKSIVIINASIYKGSIAKLCIQILLLVGKNNEIIIFFHGGSFKRVKNSNSAIVKAALPFFTFVNKFFFLSEVQKEEFFELRADAICERYRNYSMCSDVVPYYMNRGGFYRLLFVGRITKEKGVFEVLDSFVELTKGDKNKFQLDFVGEGDAIDSLRSIIRNLSIDNVVFHGYLAGEDLQNMYSSADMVILPSYAEAFPYVFVESMRSGVPMLATAVGALPDLIINDYNGYIIKNSDPVLIFNAMHRHFEKCDADKIVIRNNCHKFFKEELSKNSAETFYKKILSEL